MEHLAERQRLEEAAMPLMLDAMWAANVLDIEGTLRSVCKKVCPLLPQASTARSADEFMQHSSFDSRLLVSGDDAGGGELCWTLSDLHAC